MLCRDPETCFTLFLPDEYYVCYKQAAEWAQRGRMHDVDTYIYTQAYTHINTHSRQLEIGDSLQLECASVGHSCRLCLTCHPYRPATFPAGHLMNGSAGKNLWAEPRPGSELIEEYSALLPTHRLSQQEWQRNHHVYQSTSLSTAPFQQDPKALRKIQKFPLLVLLGHCSKLIEKWLWGFVSVQCFWLAALLLPKLAYKSLLWFRHSRSAALLCYLQGHRHELTKIAAVSHDPHESPQPFRGMQLRSCI